MEILMVLIGFGRRKTKPIYFVLSTVWCVLRKGIEKTKPNKANLD